MWTGVSDGCSTDTEYGAERRDRNLRPIAPARRHRRPPNDRARLGAGARLDGPAILTQLDATTLVLPGQVAEMDAFGNLIVGESAG
jgi:N-methylhydantoinase A/oxoprolinase/acetone carboxylase beta subunit